MGLQKTRKYVHVDLVLNHEQEFSREARSTCRPLTPHRRLTHWNFPSMCQVRTSTVSLRQATLNCTACPTKPCQLNIKHTREEKTILKCISGSGLTGWCMPFSHSYNHSLAAEESFERQQRTNTTKLRQKGTFVLRIEVLLSVACMLEKMLEAAVGAPPF